MQYTWLYGATFHVCFWILPYHPRASAQRKKEFRKHQRTVKNVKLVLQHFWSRWDWAFHQLALWCKNFYCGHTIISEPAHTPEVNGCTNSFIFGVSWQLVVQKYPLPKYTWGYLHSNLYITPYNHQWQYPDLHSLFKKCKLRKTNRLNYIS